MPGWYDIVRRSESVRFLSIIYIKNTSDLQFEERGRGNC
jgi:hypothetical protein